MTNWNELKRPFRKALIDAFNSGSLEAMLQYHCHRRLETLTSKNKKLPEAVDDVIDNAVRRGWLKALAEGALAANQTHAGLTRVVPKILAGIERDDNAFYQMLDEEIEEPLDKNLEPYLDWLIQQSERLALSLLDPGGAKSAKLDLGRVFINLHATPRQEKISGETEKVFLEWAALAAIHAERQLILLGDPGSGKSTLLRYLVLCLSRAARYPSEKWLELLKWQREYIPAEIAGRRIRNASTASSIETKQREKDIENEERSWTDMAPLPIFIELRDFASTAFNPQSPLAIWQYVEQQLNKRGLAVAVNPLKALAQKGRVIFLLDGVDEVSGGQRPDVWQAIQSMSAGVYACCRWVATCRILSFDATEAPEGVPNRTLQPLTNEQIDGFIESWYTVLAEMGEVSSDRAESLTRHLQQQTKRPDLQELASNPMLLTIMAIVQTYYGTLPEERARLYQACVDTLLLRWQIPKEREKKGKTLPDMLATLGVNQQKLERLLWEIAWQAHAGAITRQERADIKEGEIMALAAKHLGGYDKAEQFLAYTEQRAHLLVGRGGLGERVFVFPHRTFQEYLAACYLTPGIRLFTEAPQLAAEGDLWREVLNLAAGALVYNNNNYEQVLYAVERMVPRRLPKTEADWCRIWLAGEMAAVVGRQNFEESDLAAELLPALRNALVALLANEALTPQQRAKAGDALGKLGDPRPGVCTLEPALIEIPAGAFLYGKDKEKRQIDKPFAIARYPVTAAQFGMFMDAGGYKEPRYWGGEASKGWRWRVSEHLAYRGTEPITQPEYWLQPRWHGENRPIVGVSWYEAVAYCAWLTETSGRTYRLPTEYEWERAARHTDGREWAWGNTWADGIINSAEAQIERPTAVGAFPRGVAACGAHDMSGNVWEWTASFFDDKHNRYSVRGGSWNNSRNGARVAYRNRNNPSNSDSSGGFRVVSPVF